MNIWEMVDLAKGYITWSRRVVVYLMELRLQDAVCVFLLFSHWVKRTQTANQRECKARARSFLVHSFCCSDIGFLECICGWLYIFCIIWDFVREDNKKREVCI